MKKIKDVNKDVETINPEIVDNTSGFTLPQQKFVNDLFNGFFGKQNGLSHDDAKTLDTVKIVLASIYDTDRIKSLTNLTIADFEDLNELIYYNIYADNYVVDKFIKDRLELLRSIIGEDRHNVLQILTDIVRDSGINLNGLQSDSFLGKLKR